LYEQFLTTYYICSVLFWNLTLCGMLCIKKSCVSQKRSHFTHVVIFDLGETCMIYQTYPVTYRVPVLWFQTHVRDIQSLSDMFDLYEVGNDINTMFISTLQIMYTTQYSAQSFLYVFVTFIPNEFENVPQNPWPHCVVFVQNISWITSVHSS
jgi:hypothetical protein